MVVARNLGRSEPTIVEHSTNDLRSGTKLSCGIHNCPQRCHQLFDHSKMQCRKLVEFVCPRSHRLTRPCFRKDPSCRLCDAEDRRQERIRQRDHELEVERELKQKEYARQLGELQDEIAHQRRILRDRSAQEERENVLRQYRQDLASLRDTVMSMENRKRMEGWATPPENQASTTAASPGATTYSTPDTRQAAVKNQDKGNLGTWTSSAKAEWEHQKEFEGARNEALDSLMSMIGLEDVKEMFLSIKSKVDTAIRQNINMKDERFGATLLGNPGTGSS